MINKLKEKWDEILNNFKTEGDISEISFKSWLLPLKIISIEENIITLGFPDTEIGLNVLKKKYLNSLKNFINDALDTNYELNIISSKSGTSTKDQLPDNINTFASSGINSKQTFDNFVVGDNNNMAHAAALACAEDPGENYNPLFIYGGSGLGKTHLMYAIGNFIQQANPDAKVLYVTSEIYLNEIVNMIRYNKNEAEKNAIRNKYRNVDVLLIDDIQAIIGKESSQLEFFNTYNYLYDQKKQIVISSDKSPNEMETLEERFRSRFLSGLLVDIQPPNYETRMAILIKKSEEENLYLEQDVIEFIAENIKTNIRELEGALKRIKLYSEISSTPMDIENAKKVLVDFISSENDTEISPKNIIKIVCEQFDLSLEDMVSKKKSRDISYPRQIAMYLIRNMTDVSYEAIGKLLGGKDHTTVKHGVEKIDSDIKEDESTRLVIETLKKKIIPS